MKHQLLQLFDLHHDQAEPDVIDRTIRNGVQIVGTNLWVLIFAILLASIGLNVNSAAVIIGAMLISPLMGPIIGIGYSVATNDDELIKTAARNLALFVGISLLTSVVYFKLSPLTEAHSELLARTTPTFWDVLIAFFGGSAGIVALTRKHSSPVIPGVAIATALMPPLCTAGFGLATGNLAFFGGAFFLFSINSVFIALSTALFVRLMKLPQHAHANPAMQRRTRQWISLLLVIMIVPSTWLTYRLVREELFIKAGNDVLKTIDGNTGFFELSHQVLPKRKSIIITIGGGLPPKDLGDRISQAMSQSGFPGVEVEIRYLGTANLADKLDQDIREQYTSVLAQLDSSNKLITSLAAQNQKLKSELTDNESLVQELLAQYPGIDSVAIAPVRPDGRNGSLPGETWQVTVMLSRNALPASDQRRIAAWLKARLKGKRIILLYGNAASVIDGREEPKAGDSGATIP